MLTVPRPLVVARLRESVETYALTIVAAPLGSGKSSALRLAFVDSPNVARLDVEPWHRGAFVAALVETVRSVRDDFGRRTLGMLAGDASATALGRTFALDLHHLRTPLVIVVDNAHLVYDDPDVGEFVRAVLRELPEPVRLLFAGRTLPEFDLIELVALGRVTIVRGDALRFDAAETRSLARGLDRDLGDDEIAAIDAATDGWAAAIVLALAAGTRAIPALQSVAAAQDYLERALLPTLDPAAVDFLEATAVFETLDTRILERSPDFGSARSILTSLERRGALVSALAAAGSFRVHPILRDLARKRLATRGGLRQAHLAAVDVYLDAALLSAALYHIVAAGDAPVAARFLRAHVAGAIATGNRRAVRAAADLVDRTGNDADVVALVDAFDAKAKGSADVRARFVTAATAAGSGDAHIAFLAQTQIIEHDLGRLRRVDPVELAQLRERAERLGPGPLATVEMLAGWAAAIAFEFQSAYDRIAPIVRSGDSAARANTGVLLAYVQSALGEFGAAAETLDELVRLLEDDDRIVLQTSVLIWFARLALTWGATHTARDAAAAAERLVAAFTFRAEEAALYAACTELATHFGDRTQTLTYAELARDRARSAWYVADTARIAALAELAVARAAFLADDFALARRLTQRAAELPRIPPAMQALALAEAAVYTLLTDPADAAGAIAGARTAVRGAAPVDLGDAAALATAADLLAFLAAANGEAAAESVAPPGPFDAFVAQRRGLVTLEFVGITVGRARRGQGSADALTTAFEHFARQGPRFEGRLARAYAAQFVTVAKPSPKPAPAFDLTSRESEILALLVDGLTNKEIAQRVIVSPRTVETHVERILGKLEVGSRSRAIAKALRLGLVDLDRSSIDP